VKLKEARAALAKRAHAQKCQTVSTSQPVAPKVKRTGLSVEQKDLGEWCSHVVCGWHVVKASTPSPTPNPIPQADTKAPKLPQVNATKKKAKNEKVETKIRAAPKTASVKPKKAASNGAKPVTESLIVANPPSTSPLEDISDLDSFLHEACVQLTRRRLTSVSSLPKGAVRPRAFLKAVILFVAEYGSAP
jgi:hypothetical protein